MGTARNSVHSIHRQCLGWSSSWKLQQKRGVPRWLMQAPTTLGRTQSSGQCSSAPQAVQKAFPGTRGPVLVNKLPLIITVIWLHALKTGLPLNVAFCCVWKCPLLDKACMRAAVLRMPWWQSRWIF